MPAESASSAPSRSVTTTRPRTVSAARRTVAVERLGVVEVPGHGRGHDVGLRARLRADLRVDAVAQADRERDLQRDDREQQDVRERQQQAPAQRHWNSSGAVKRKPTPRTVCR